MGFKSKGVNAGKSFFEILRANRARRALIRKQPALITGGNGNRLPIIGQPTPNGSFMPPIVRQKVAPVRPREVINPEVLAKPPVVIKKGKVFDAEVIPKPFPRIATANPKLLPNRIPKEGDTAVAPVGEADDFTIDELRMFDDFNQKTPKAKKPTTTSTKKPMARKPGPKKPGPVKGSKNVPKPQRYATVDPLNLFGNRNGVNPFGFRDEAITNDRFNGGVVPTKSNPVSRKKRTLSKAASDTLDLF